MLDLTIPTRICPWFLLQGVGHAGQLEGFPRSLRMRAWNKDESWISMPGTETMLQCRIFFRSEVPLGISLLVSRKVSPEVSNTVPPPSPSVLHCVTIQLHFLLFPLSSFFLWLTVCCLCVFIVSFLLPIWWLTYASLAHIDSLPSWYIFHFTFFKSKSNCASIW